MLRIWLALLFSITAVIMIGLLGMINHARISVVLFRMVVSIAICTGIGVIAGFVYEKQILPYMQKNLKTDVESSNDSELIQEEKEELAENAAFSLETKESQDEKKELEEFAPFTTENFKRVSPPNS